MYFKNVNEKSLIDKTSTILRTNPDSIFLSPRNEFSLWGQVCLDIFGKFSFTNALLIQTWWKRNKNGYQDNVITNINDSDDSKLPNYLSDDDSVNVSNKEADFNKKLVFNKEETELIKKHVSNKGANGRKYFLKQFDKILNAKIKKYVPCKLKCNSNWFKKISGRKKTLPCWRGKYSCLFERCTVLFNALSYMNLQACESYEVVISWNTKPTHLEIIEKQRCDGDLRKTLRVELMANGIENTRNDIINKSNLSL